MLTADENQTNSTGGNQQNIGPNANISGVLAQNVGGNAQVGGKGAQFGGNHEKRKFLSFFGKSDAKFAMNISKISNTTEWGLSVAFVTGSVWSTILGGLILCFVLQLIILQ